MSAPRLTAAHGGARTRPAQLTVHAAASAVNSEARTIMGTIVPYGVVGYTSMGPTIFLAGSLTTPDDLGRVKLLVQHDASAAAVGYMTAMTDSAEAASGVWHLPAGPEGDDALGKAANSLRDGLSLGVTLLDYSFDADDNLVVRAASLYEVSLVTIPAFADSRVLDVAAARKELPVRTRAQLAAALTAGSIDQAEHDRLVTELEAAAAPLTPATPATPAPQAVQAAAEQPAPTERQADPVTRAGRRAGLQAAIAATEQHLREGAPLGQLRAALEDITSTTTGHREGHEDGVVGGDSFLGEVWRASRVRRPLIDAGRRAALTALRVYGWHWVNTPKVPKYEGEKTAIASNKWSTTTVDAEAQAYAGGWDVERKLIDLGAPGLVETAYSKATDDYKLNTEADVAAQLIAAATVVPEQLTLTSALAQLGVRAATLGSTINVVQFGADVWAEFVSLPESEVPWWLRSQGAINLGTVNGSAGGMTFEFNPALSARQVFAGDGQAWTFYEVEPPIRVRAENIPNGGVDLGVFGYAALIVNDSRAIFTTTIAAPSALRALQAGSDDAGSDDEAGQTPAAK